MEGLLELCNESGKVEGLLELQYGTRAEGGRTVGRMELEWEGEGPLKLWN
jgi:hypothetical protein